MSDKSKLAGKEAPLWWEDFTTLQLVLFWAIFQVVVLVVTLALGYRTFILEAHQTRENHFHFVLPEFLAKIGVPDCMF